MPCKQQRPSENRKTDFQTASCCVSSAVIRRIRHGRILFFQKRHPRVGGAAFCPCGGFTRTVRLLSRRS
ncbi:hypothetical protein HMPREF9123_1488 [Neisseria bacilliformis ATCC BAA-1200]|uniref:Uncharacterized protein n=1 Tax=Neisseria bacilliformis ATCC BAA-1200 TaxID=888742 RepID=F2BCR3_9NEIS|nr:hypothetical protein HMPREF9123_1488 [Neisseria bacilliformis ATCC BAA-1200]